MNTDSESAEYNDAEITTLLNQVQQGSQVATEKLIEVIYGQLQDMANGLMGKEREGHTLQPTALVNEAVMKLLKSDTIRKSPNRKYLFGSAYRAMRQVLVDHARRRKTRPEGKRNVNQSLDVLQAMIEESCKSDIEQLESALAELERTHPRQYEVVVGRFLGGQSVMQTAELLDVSIGTIENDWRMGRAWLYRRLQSRGDGKT